MNEKSGTYLPGTANGIVLDIARGLFLFLDEIDHHLVTSHVTVCDALNPVG